MAIVKARPDASVNQNPPVSTSKPIQRGIFSLSGGAGNAIISTVNPLKAKLNFSVKDNEAGFAAGATYFNGAAAVNFAVAGIIAGPNSIQFSSKTYLSLGSADGEQRYINGGNATIYWEVEESV